MTPPAPNPITVLTDDRPFNKKNVSVMKRYIVLGVVFVMMLVSLGGCCWPRYWHDGYGHGRHGYGYGHDHFRGNGYHARR